MKKKINVGIIGKNFGLKVILRAFQKNMYLNVVAFSSLRKPENKTFQKKNINFYSNWKNMINSKSIDAVAIATPPKTQQKIINYAIRKNKHIFCEKPFTESYLKAKKLVEILRRKKKIANIVNFIFPEIHYWKLLKEKLKRKQIIKEVELVWHMNSKFKKESWKYKHSQGGAVLYNYACHSVYYLEYLFGKINFLESKILYKNRDLPYRLRGIFHFFSGAKAKVDINLFSKKKLIHQIKVKTTKSNFNLSSNIDSLCDRFELEIRNKKRKVSKLYTPKNPEKNDFRIDPTYKNSIKFSKSILSNKVYKPNFENALRVHYILNSIIKSSKLKKTYFLN